MQKGKRQSNETKTQRTKYIQKDKQTADRASETLPRATYTGVAHINCDDTLGAILSIGQYCMQSNMQICQIYNEYILTLCGQWLQIG